MGLTYRDAGVDQVAGDDLVERIKPLVRATMRPEVLAGGGGFAALCGIPQGYREPLLVSGTDGVGTKLKIAFLTGRHDTVGIDLVAMCVNDVITCGAEPLFFLDYFATGRLEIGVAEQVISGIARGCIDAGCALVGGETAELPGFYADGEYDLAGFAVGVVERANVLDGHQVLVGDKLVGVASRPCWASPRAASTPTAIRSPARSCWSTSRSRQARTRQSSAAPRWARRSSPPRRSTPAW